MPWSKDEEQEEDQNSGLNWLVGLLLRLFYSTPIINALSTTVMRFPHRFLSSTCSIIIFLIVSVRFVVSYWCDVARRRLPKRSSTRSTDEDMEKSQVQRSKKPTQMWENQVATTPTHHHYRSSTRMRGARAKDTSNDAWRITQLVEGIHHHNRIKKISILILVSNLCCCRVGQLILKSYYYVTSSAGEKHL
jgi:hypothetical protein